MKKITILECCGALGIGGMERAMQEFALNIDKKKFNVVVGAFDIDGPRRKIIEQHGIKVVKLEKGNIGKLLADNNIDIVHAHGVDTSECYGKAIVLREVVFWGDFDTRADMNLVISKTLFLKYNTVPKAKLGKNICVLYYPQAYKDWRRKRLTPAQIQDYRRQRGIPDNAVVVGRLGRAEPSKTDYLLLASLSKIVKKSPNVYFLFTGLPLLFRWIIALNPAVRRRVRYIQQTGDDKKISAFYSSIDIFWHTAQRGETFGNVNAEAMCFAKPVITHSTPFTTKNWKTTDNAQIEIVDHAKTGLVASFPSDVAQGIYKLAQDPLLASKMGKAGEAKVRELYAADKVVRVLEDLCHSIVAMRDKHPISPHSKEVKQYIRGEYASRLKSQIRVARPMEKWVYKNKKVIFEGVSFLYLASRYILRKYAGVDIERKS